MTTHASFDLVEFKAEDDGKRGLFAALVSVFRNVDRNGDRVMPGAFQKTLERWRASGKPIPVIFSHEKNDPTSFIGTVDPLDVKETPDGLVVAGKLDIESNPKAAQVYELLKDGRIDQWSFSYQAKDERIGDDLARELFEVDLFEVGPTLVGANGSTRTLAVKSAEESPSPAVTLEGLEAKVDAMLEEKIGRIVSAKTEERVRAAIAQLNDILSQLGEQEEENPTETAAASQVEEKVEEPAPTPDPSPYAATLEQAEAFLASRGKDQLTRVAAATGFLGDRS